MSASPGARSRPIRFHGGTNIGATASPPSSWRSRVSPSRASINRSGSGREAANSALFSVDGVWARWAHPCTTGTTEGAADSRCARSGWAVAGITARCSGRP